MYSRLQTFAKSKNNSLFLWGARQTGKSTLIEILFPEAQKFDLLQSDVYQRLLMQPELLRQAVLAQPKGGTVVIDEVQKIPAILNEVHWLIEKHKTRFILTGSSPRKILQAKENLIGGRALRYELFPLTSAEISNFNLLQALNNGLLPRHYLEEDATMLLSAYVNSFLQDEINAEAIVRNLSVFVNFLHKAAFSNAEIVNYANIAADCGVSAPTVKSYFEILQDCMLGNYVQPFQKRPKRQVVSTPKFYFFDVGIVNHLLKRKQIEYATENFGYAFEHFIFMELKAHAHYSQKNYDITFWQTRTKIEVDFVLGDHEVAIGVKATNNVQAKHLKNMKVLQEEYNIKKAIVVSTEPFARLVNNIIILPWQEFLKQLWANEIM